MNNGALVAADWQPWCINRGMRVFFPPASWLMHRRRRWKVRDNKWNVFVHMLCPIWSWTWDMSNRRWVTQGLYRGGEDGKYGMTNGSVLVHNALPYLKLDSWDMNSKRSNNLKTKATSLVGRDGKYGITKGSVVIHVLCPIWSWSLEMRTREKNDRERQAKRIQKNARQRKKEKKSCKERREEGEMLRQ